MKVKRKKSFISRPSVAILSGAVFIIAVIMSTSKFVTVYSKGGVFPSVEHGGTDSNTNTTTGASRPANTPGAGYTINTTDYPAGTCIHCHDEHASNSGVTHTAQQYLLFSTNDNNFCYTSTCHSGTMPTQGSYQYRIWMGQGIYAAAAHGTNANVLWPGANPAARPAGDQNKCLNCHNPHGVSFSAASEAIPGGSQGTGAPTNYVSTNPLPDMTFRLEENLCLTCHDGTPALNISATLARGTNTGSTGVYYNHPVSRYNAAGDRTPSAHRVIETMPLGGGGTPRHAECSDCHNPHYAISGSHTAPTNNISNVLLGAWGITHTGWPNTQAKGSGTLQPAPNFTGSPVQLTNSATQDEWQLCLRCHSSYSTLPAYAAPNNVTDISREINPNNYAHHAVAAQGAHSASANANYQNAFRAPFTYNSVIYCSDCHESSLRTGNGMAGATDPDGPHGSANQFILGNFCDSAAGANCADANQTVICFKCHKYRVYWTNASSGCGTANGCSRFPDHTTKAKHMMPYNPYGIWCLNCHGGGIDGGIHGTNAAKGVKGTGFLGENLMNGATFGGITRGTGGVGNSGLCWTKAAGDTYNANPTNGACTQHPTTGGGQNFTPNYDY